MITTPKFAPTMLDNISCRSLHFTEHGKGAPALRYVVILSNPDIAWGEFDRLYPPSEPGERVVRADHAGMDDSGSRFFAVWVADCFDPPVAIIRAENEEDGYETFVDDFDWTHIDDANLADYGGPESETVCHNSNGEPYDPEGIMMREVKLVRVDC